MGERSNIERISKGTCGSVSFYTHTHTHQCRKETKRNDDTTHASTTCSEPAQRNAVFSAAPDKIFDKLEMAGISLVMDEIITRE